MNWTGLVKNAGPKFFRCGHMVKPTNIYLCAAAGKIYARCKLCQRENNRRWHRRHPR